MIRDRNLSDLGDGPNSTYLVYDSDRKELQTGCVVLRPAKEFLSFLAFDALVRSLNENDPRFTELSDWRDRLEEFWKGVSRK
jgi:hypothetical protein